MTLRFEKKVHNRIRVLAFNCDTSNNRGVLSPKFPVNKYKSLYHKGLFKIKQCQKIKPPKSGIFLHLFPMINSQKQNFLLLFKPTIPMTHNVQQQMVLIVRELMDLVAKVDWERENYINKLHHMGQYQRSDAGITPSSQDGVITSLL